MSVLLARIPAVSLRPPFSKPLPCRVFPRRPDTFHASRTCWEDCPCKDARSQARDAGRDNASGIPQGNREEGPPPATGKYESREQGIPELAVMANVLNPETESKP